MNEAQYALSGVAVGVLVPAVQAIWQSVYSGRRAAAEREAARDDRQSAHRVELIAAWRDGVAAFQPSRTFAVGSDNPLQSFAWYLSLRPYLTPAVRKRLEPAPHVVSLAAVTGPSFQFMLADEISRIEREWGLS